LLVVLWKWGKYIDNREEAKGKALPTICQEGRKEEKHENNENEAGSREEGTLYR
jgi:hypothetical protein